MKSNQRYRHLLSYFDLCYSICHLCELQESCNRPSSPRSPALRMLPRSSCSARLCTLMLTMLVLSSHSFPTYLHDLGGLTAQLAEPSALKRTKLRLRSAFTRLLGKFQPRVKRRISSFSGSRWLRGFSNFLKRTQGTKVFLVKYLKKIE